MTTLPKETESKELRISQFNEFETKLVEFKEKYVGVVYDLTDKKQRKQAGTDRLAIGKVVVKLDKAHKDIKAPLLAKTKLLDGERKRIKDDLQSVHSEIGDQIKKHEDAIKIKAEALQDRVDAIIEHSDITYLVDKHSNGIQEHLDKLRSLPIDDSFDDRKGDAAIAKDESIQKLEGLIAVEKLHEAELAEIETKRLAQVAEDKRLEKIQIEKAAKEQAEAAAQKLIDDAKLETEKAEQRAKDAEAKTKLDASEKERLEKKRADQAEAETKRLAQKVIDDKAQAVIDQEAAVKAEGERVEAVRVENERGEAEDKAAREADTENRKAKNNAAADAFITIGFSKIAAQSAVKAIAKGSIPGVSISY